LKSFEKRLNDLETDVQLRLPSNSLGRGDTNLYDDPVYEALKQELEELKDEQFDLVGRANEMEGLSDMEEDVDRLLFSMQNQALINLQDLDFRLKNLEDDLISSKGHYTNDGFEPDASMLNIEHLMQTDQLEKILKLDS
jgi:hypothetical protein